MVLVVKCLICSKELNYEKNDPSELILHVRHEHPLINSQRSRKSETLKQELKGNAEKSLNQSLKRNSDTLNSLIDIETQTDISWRNFFESMNHQQQNTPRPSENAHRTSKDTQQSSLSTSARVSMESRSTQKSDITVVLKSPPPMLHESVSSPKRFSDDLRQFNERTPLKTTSTLMKHSSSKQVRDREKIQLEVGNGAKVLFTRDMKDEGKSRPKLGEKKKFKFYKTSIEKWRPVGDEKIHCPRCQAHKRPIVRTHTERVTESSFTTTLLMTCWPLCLSPCFFPEPTQENLHCPVCNFHLGVYDHVNKLVMSNPELSNE